MATPLCLFFRAYANNSISAFEREYILATLRITGTNISKMAEFMQISGYGFPKAMNRFGIETSSSPDTIE